ncbi:MAG: TIGR02530 family flagellar biosynthesis protein [bacterium]|jgi:flagellar operon protein|nr:TIGR02530 family flagellar biosynthesis protein [bacterium]
MNTLNIPPQGLLSPTHLAEFSQTASARQPLKTAEGKTFTEVLTSTLAEKNLDITFSAHARQRLESRQVDFDPSKLQRLDKAIELAKTKGGHESLILLDGDAYVVNIDKRTVITALNQVDTKGGIFTQIDSTVIM